MPEKARRATDLILQFAVIPFLCLSFELTIKAQSSLRNYAVEVSASVQLSPPQIVLNWLSDPKASSYTIQRRSRFEAGWSSGISLPGGANSHADSAVAVGTEYEYRVTKLTPDYVGYGYVYSGIEAPLKDYRGKALLLVDETHANDLSLELMRLEQDLAGDGWTVLRRDVSRSASVSSVKSFIKAEYQADPGNLRTVFLLGHVPVPYAGDIYPDGHTNHQGAWPADVFYADMDGLWTDSSVNSTKAERRENWNIPGDGKFDQGVLPSDAELEIGRVDLSDMTAFANKQPSRSEKDLLRQYLNKNHNFRHRQFNVERRGLIVDHFGLRGADPVVTSGWRNFAPFFGANNVFQVAVSNYLAATTSGSYLWAYGAGGGSYYYSAGVATADDFALNDVRVVFGMFLGSYYGDWNNESNFLRAFLGSSGYSLVALYAGFPHWFCHHMALGETIGYSTKLTQNNGTRGLYPPFGQGAREVHIALLGDPTLRMHPVIPPSDLTATSDARGVTLRWTASHDSGLRGHHVYRATSSRGPFARRTDAPLASNVFIDAPPAGTYVYMIRAIKLEQSASGTYLNPSQGTFVSIAAGTTTPAPSTPVALTGQKASDGIFYLRLTGPTDAKFVVDVSIDLMNWSVLLTDRFERGERQVSDSGARQAPWRFYRSRLVP
jgi:hypothetical protein